MRFRPALVATLASLALFATACGGDDDSPTSTGAGADAGTADAAGAGDVPVIAVTTNILGDVVTNLFGDAVEVDVLMPVGVDPHDFQISAQEAAGIRDAELLIVNGADFEAGLESVIDSAVSDGVVVVEAIEFTDELDYTDDDDHGDDDHGDDDHGDDDHGDDDHGDEDHGDEDHADEDHADEDHADDEHGDDDHGDDDHAHDHDGVDPHFFTDPVRMAEAASGIVDAVVAQVPALDTDAVRATADDYLDRLDQLDDEIAAILADVAPEDRQLVTNHEVFGYFADRYDFEVIGTVVPGGTPSDGVSGGTLDALASVVEAAGVPAIFVDTSSPAALADALADEVGDIAVVELYTESLGDADSDGASYVAMVTANAERIAAALGG